MLKKIIPFVILVPFSIFVLLSFLGCGVTTSGPVIIPPRLYVTNVETQEVLVVDVATYTIEDSFFLPARVNDWATLSPNGKKIYLPSRDTNEIFIINTETMSYSGNINVGSLPSDIEFTSDGSRALVVQSGQVTLLNAFNDTLITSASFIDATGNSRGVALNPHNNRMYVVCENSDKILSFAISGETVTQISTISGYSDMVDICFPPESDLFFVSRGYMSPNEFLIYRATDEVYVTKLSASNSTPGKMTPAPNGGYVYACPLWDMGSNSWVDFITVSDSPSLNEYDVETWWGADASYVKDFAVSPDSQIVYLYYGGDFPGKINTTRIMKVGKDFSNLVTYATFEVVAPPDFSDYYGSVIYVP